MLAPLLVSLAMVGLAAGLFGLYLARLLTVDGCPEDAAETRHHAGLLLSFSAMLLTFGMLWVG
jgi:hypothetical protein